LRLTGLKTKKILIESGHPSSPLRIDNGNSCQALRVPQFTKMTFFAHVKIDSRFFKMLMVPLAGFLVGTYFDRMETERQSMFRDKSALYGRELAEGEKPSWP
ncbi:NADH dehydrogenase [ubiquinone] 1 beta subcomplex subunit 1-like, partial [Homarus americanus]